jgi:hypothetical protein
LWNKKHFIGKKNTGSKNKYLKNYKYFEKGLSEMLVDITVTQTNPLPTELIFYTQHKLEHTEVCKWHRS